MLRGENDASQSSERIFDSILAHAGGIVDDIARLEAAELLELTVKDIENLRETGDNLARAGLLLTELTADLSSSLEEEDTIEFGSEDSYGVVLRYLCITRKFQLVTGQELLAHLRKANVEIGDATAEDIMLEIEEWAADIREDARTLYGTSGHVALIGDNQITFGDDGTNLPEKVAPKPVVRQKRQVAEAVAPASDADNAEPETDPVILEVVGRTIQLLEPGPMKASKLLATLARDSGAKPREFIRNILLSLLEQGKIFRYRNEAVYYTIDPCVENYKVARRAEGSSEKQRKKEKELNIELATDVLTVLTRPYSGWQTKNRPDEIYRHIHPETSRVPKDGLEAIKDVIWALKRVGIVNAREAKKGTRPGGSGLGQKAMRSNSHQVLMVWLKSQRVKEGVKRALETNALSEYLEHFTPDEA